MPLPAKLGQPPRSVLWVDDEAELLEPHRLFLADRGYDVVMATNADDAVEMLRRRSYDVLLLDEQMPGKRGLDAYREMREIAPQLPVVMVTKSENDATLRSVRRRGQRLPGQAGQPAAGAFGRDQVARRGEHPSPGGRPGVRRAIPRAGTGARARADWRGWIERYDELVRWDLIWSRRESTVA
jgi:CheY-like chemotaxis protein